MGAFTEPMVDDHAEREREWETEEDVRSLRRVAELRGDKGRMKRARAMILAQRDELERAGEEM